MNLLDPVSNRQFAKMVGQSEGAVRKAIARQSILEGITADKKIIPLVASNEWGKVLLPEYLTAQNLKETPALPKKKPQRVVVAKPAPVVKQKTVSVVPVQKPKPTAKIPATKTTRKSKPEPTTADEYVDEMMHEPLPKVSKEDIDNFNESDEQEMSEGTTKVEAERRIAIFKAKMAEIALREKQGELLPRVKLEKVLFGYGQEIRTTLTAIPAQVIDKIRACDTRHEALRILDDSIYDALNLLTDIEGREI